jgi:hypothetical protein
MEEITGCTGSHKELLTASALMKGYRAYQRLCIVKREGLGWTARLLLHKCGLVSSMNGEKKAVSRAVPLPEALNLKAGELVKVKSAEEIRETLDSSEKTQGLYFMREMWNYCGQQFRVYKPLKRMLLESTLELRNVKNIVLLENNFCDGSEHWGCDRSCLHFWKEAWLKRVETKTEETL